MTTQNQTEQAKEQATEARETAANIANQMKEGAKDQAQKMAEQSRQAWSDIQEEPTPSGIQGALENLPAPVYLYACLGSMGFSLLLRLLGRKDFANFVGLWPPTILALAMLNKQFRPSREM